MHSEKELRVYVQLCAHPLKKLTGHGNEKDQHKGNKVVEFHLLWYFSAFLCCFMSSTTERESITGVESPKFDRIISAIYPTKMNSHTTVLRDVFWVLCCSAVAHKDLQSTPQICN